MKNKITENIKRELKERQSNINKLCRTLGVNRNYISQLKDNTPISKLKKIADAIGCDLLNLFVGVQTHKLFLSIPFFKIIYLIECKVIASFPYRKRNGLMLPLCWLQSAKIQFEIQNQFAEIEGGGCFFCGFCAKNFSRPNNYI